MDLLIRDLLAYSRIGYADLRVQPVDLATVVTEAAAQLAPDLQERKARLTVEEPLPRVVGHHATLVQVVANLLTNAVKFVAAGVEPQARIWAEENGELVRLWVEDNGIGIAPEHHQRIFGMFEPARDRGIPGQRGRAGHRSESGGADGGPGGRRVAAGPREPILGGIAKGVMTSRQRSAISNQPDE